MSELTTEMDVVITRENARKAPDTQIGTWHMKRWTWYQKQTAISRATTITDVKKGIGALNMEDFYAEVIGAVVVKPPEALAKIWEKPDARISFIKNELDVDVGDKLRDGYLKLCDLELRSFLPPSDSGTPTPG